MDDNHGVRFLGKRGGRASDEISEFVLSLWHPADPSETMLRGVALTGLRRAVPEFRVR
jgi:hypothetical protein